MTVVDRIRQRADRHAQLVGVVDGTTVLTYADLFDRVDRLSHALVGLGVPRGEPVLAFLPNCHEAVECELAALQSGIVWITLNSRLTWGEVRGVLAQCRPRLIITDEAGRRKIAGGLETIPFDPVPPVVVTRGGGPSGRPSGRVDDPFGYEALLSSYSPARPTVPVASTDIARLRYTSGTTGSAKAAVLPHRVYDAILENLLGELHPLGESDRTLHAAPLTHGGGALIYPTLFAGGQNIIVPRFDVEEVLGLIEQYRITTMFTVPTILSRLIASPAFERADLSSLRSLIYGGAPMPEEQLRSAVGKIGHALLHIYGMTEAPWPITTLEPEEHRLDNPRLRSVGKPTRVCEVRVVDEAGNEVPPGVVGEIQIRGRNVMDGYFENPEATAAVLRNGWLSSGDLAKKDEAGYIFIVGRKKDVIITGGFNVYATEVEQAICSHAAVLEAAVVGLPHADWGEVVTAFVVPKPGRELGAPELDRFVRQRLSGYKCPRRIELVGELPKNSSGKILKPVLVDEYTRGWA